MRLTDEEARRYERDGFLVREKAFTMDEVEELRAASEQLCEELAAVSGKRKMRVSEHYVFEPDLVHELLIKWEPGADVIQGLEPCAHLHPVLQKYADHPAFVEPCKDILGLDEIGLYTEKLNVKRAHVGGSYALHQDYPYWRSHVDDVERIVTVWVALDDASAANGALEVLPGSHRLGWVQGKTDGGDMERNEIDPATFDTSAMIPVEVPTGAAIFFGPYLVHTSGPNNSDHDRRALLYTYQGAGQRTSLDHMRELVASQRVQ